jgi:quinol monooxygenase YgiN
VASNLLTVIAKIQAKPGMEERVKQGLLAMVGPSRREEGNRNYDILQSNDNPAIFFTYENWTGKAALDHHMQTPHFKHLEQENKETLAMPMDVQLLTAQSAPTDA